MRRLAPVLTALALAGCGSVATADLPAPAGPPVSPPLTEPPATLGGGPGNTESLTFHARSAFVVNGPRDRLIRVSDRREVQTGRQPIAVAELDRGRKVAVLTGRERTLEIYDAKTLERLGKTGAGIGPTGLATDGVQVLYVTDVRGNALLVFRLRPRFELIRRVHVSGGPYAIAFDEERWGLWIARPGVNRVDHYAAGFRPVLRESFPAIANAREVFVLGADVWVRGSGKTQVLRPRSR